VGRWWTFHCVDLGTLQPPVHPSWSALRMWGPKAIGPRGLANPRVTLGSTVPDGGGHHVPGPLDLEWPAVGTYEHRLTLLQDDSLPDLGHQLHLPEQDQEHDRLVRAQVGGDRSG